MASVEKLISALDAVSGAVLYTFAQGEEMDQSFSYEDTIVALQGRDYGYDALGFNPAPLKPRKLVWKFIHPLVGTESYTTIRNTLVKGIGQGRPILLNKLMPDGTYQLCDARLIDVPDRAIVTHSKWVEYTLTFAQRADWYVNTVTGIRYDTGLHYDAGFRFDTQGVVQPMPNATGTVFTLTNGGTTTEWGGLYIFTGPFNGFVNLYNYSADPRGVPIPAGVTPTAYMQLTILIGLGASQSVTISSKDNTVTTNVPGAIGWQLVTKAPGQRYYFGLVPGVNSLALSQGSAVAGGFLTAFVHDRYR